MLSIKRIDETSKKDLFLPNEPFSLWGRMVPTYDGRSWSYTTETFEEGEVRELVFPEEHYDFEAMKDTHFFVGAYSEQGECIGLAVYKRDHFKYLYLEDLKVSRAFRGQAVGKLMISEGLKIASENGYQGLYTIAQDNNLSACLFYIRNGFVIGGLNTHVYLGTSQADKSNIYFYL